MSSFIFCVEQLISSKKVSSNRVSSYRNSSSWYPPSSSVQLQKKSSCSSALKKWNCSNNRLSWFEQFHFLCRAVDFFKKVSSNHVSSYHNSSSWYAPSSSGQLKKDKRDGWSPVEVALPQFLTKKSNWVKLEIELVELVFVFVFVFVFYTNKTIKYFVGD